MNRKSQNTANLSKILRELYLLFPDPNLYSLLHSLQEPLSAQNPEEMKKIIEHNLQYLSEKKQMMQNHFHIKEKEVESFMQDPSNFLPDEWQAIEKIKSLFSGYQAKASQVIESGNFPKKKAPKSKFAVDLPRKKGAQRKKDWIPCK